MRRSRREGCDILTNKDGFSVLPATRPLIVGEVLFDHFPGGQRVLGGAPFNVAWNLQGLGLAPLFVSAIGEDEEGAEIRSRMEVWGLDTSGLQISAAAPTGQVRVTLQDGEPQFQILDKQAYDQIQPPPFDISQQDFSLLYLGSLAYRSEPSRSTIRGLMRHSGLPRFVDLNIRQPWFELGSVPELLNEAVWIKLNNHELAYISELPCGSSEEIRTAVELMRGRHGGRQYFITCGGGGAYAIDDSGEVLFAEAPSPEPMIDAVGAGDAFTAAAIHGIVNGRTLSTILTSAVAFASRACTIRGATSLDRAHYGHRDSV